MLVAPYQLEGALRCIDDVRLIAFSIDPLTFFGAIHWSGSGNRLPAVASAPVAAPFRAYYDRYSGPRTLGPPITDLQSVDGWPAQYFEKGRLEDHRASISDPTWQILGGRLTVELMPRDPRGSVNGRGLTYAALAEAAAPHFAIEGETDDVLQP